MTPLLSFSFLFLFLFAYVRAETKSSLQSSISSANASVPLFSNTSSTSNSSFSYIIPFGQTQDCNIYGPTCQTGSITVGVNLITATTTTVLPCSSYLSAQSSYLNEGNDEEGFPGGGQGSWDSNFGQSPECRSFAEAWGRGTFTFSNCGSIKTATQTAAGWLLPQVPPGVPQYFDPRYQGACCGNCSLDVPAVKLYYFPDNASIDCHNNQTTNGTSALLAQGLEKRVHSLITNGSTAVIDGHTFTSPSLYLQLLGTATISDRCTTVGPKLINPIITLPPGGLSTWRPSPDDWDNYTVGEIWEDHSDIPGFDYDLAGVAPLDVRGLACPTWGLGKNTSANGKVITTIGPPWLPLIVPPMNIFTLNPTWSSLCTGIYTPWGELSTFALFDPPIALTPAPLLAPSPVVRSTPAPAPADPTSIPEQAKPTKEAAKPVSLPNDPAAPAKTGDPGKNTPAQSPDKASPDPSGSANVPENSVAPSKNKGDPSSDPSTDPPSDPPSAPNSPSVDGEPSSSSSSASDPTPKNAQKSPTDAFSKIRPHPTSAVSLPPQSVFATGAQAFTTNPTGSKVSNAAITPGGTAQTVDATIISVNNSEILAMGSSTVSLTNPSATPILAVAGQTFTPNPSAFFIAGNIVSAGGPAVIVGGTAISLDPSRVLTVAGSTVALTAPSSTPFAEEAFTVAGQTSAPNPSAFSITGTTILSQHGALRTGSSTINLPTPSNIFPSKVYTVAGQVFTPNTFAFLIAGTTISAGSRAVTINGTVIRLNQSGALAIGSSTIDLPTSSYNSLGQVHTVAGQVFTPNPSTFTVASTTISAGGPAATVDIDGFDVIAHSSFAVVDGITVSAAAAGVTVSGKVVSLEAGGATLDIGGRFVLPTPVAGTNNSVNMQAFMGGQSKGLEMSVYLVWGVCGALTLLMWH